MPVRFIEAGLAYQGFWANFWDLIWWFLWIFVFFAYIFALFSIIADLFRDHTLKGGWKAVWIFFLIFFPVVTALIYLIARGSGMSRRSVEAAKQYQTAQEDYIKSVAGASPSDEIAKAKSLLDNGTISQGEYDQIKAKVLAG